MTWEQTLRRGRKGSYVDVVERVLHEEETGSAKALRLGHAWGAQGAQRKPVWLEQSEHRERGRR